MLLKLSIKNLILIESAELNFTPGLNVLSGETGAGKSAMIQALRLVLGERADPALIRKGEEKAVVEAFLDVHDHSKLLKFLDDSGIDHEPGELLRIRRELSVSGKNRCFINQQLAPLSFIEKVSFLLVDLVLQHAHQRLFSLEAHLHLLDTYSQNLPLLEAFKTAWEEQSSVEKQLHALTCAKEKGLRHLEQYQTELAEITDAKLQEEEEEELFKEYSTLTSQAEMGEKLQEIISSFFEGKFPLLPFLNKQKVNIEALAASDKTLQDANELFSTILTEMNELSYLLNRYQSSLEVNPRRLAFTEDRLALISMLKKKYGPTLADIAAHRAYLQETLNHIESIDDSIASTKERLIFLQKTTDQLAKELSEKRQMHASELAKKIEVELRVLNIPKALFQIDLFSRPRGSTGDEGALFKFAPNVGEAMLSLKECASGGELSRVMLALKSILAGKEEIPTLIFDEIDANMGGETAAVVGEKLSAIAKNHQVLCITHLPQVACLAVTHFQIKKLEKEGRTYSSALLLDKRGKQQELSRMLGLTTELIVATK